jgi:hypothetical protein
LDSPIASFSILFPTFPGGIDALMQQASDFVSSFDVLLVELCHTYAQLATERFEWLFSRFPK